MKLYWLKEEKILNQISAEFDYGKNHIETKRTTRREDVKLYVRESEEDRVDVHSIYTTVQTLLAINYLNEIAVEFSKRKNWDEERAENANICAEFDYWEMDLDVKDYTWELNRLMTWVWIQTAWDFDFTSIHPTIDNVDSLAYIFDPKWWPTIKDHRFFGIETEMTEFEMKQSKYENYNDLDTIIDTVYENQSNTDTAREQNTTFESQENKKFPVTIFWTIFKWEKYIAVTWNWNKKLLKFTKLEPVFLEEEKSPSKIMFPIALKYFSFLPWDSMWISPFDLLRSKQSAYSILFNLMLKMAYKNAMWGDRLINTKKIKDLSGLAVPSLEGKDIPVNVEKDEDINNTISYVQKDTPTWLPQELRVWLQEESILDTWIDRNTQWVLWQWNNTLWEREMAQKNANLRFLLWSKQAMWGEIFRWKYLWYRQYAANLKSIDKKEFALETWYSEDFHVFQKDDFVWEDMLHLKLQSKAEIQQERESMKLDRLALYPQQIWEAQAEWQTRKVIVLQRNRMLDIWEPKQRVKKTYPYTIDELSAMDKMAILKLAIKQKENENWKIAKNGLSVDNLDETHEIFIEYYQTLPENTIKRRAIAKRYEAIKEKARLQQQPMQQPWQQSAQSWPTNTAANVSVAQASAQQVWTWMRNWPDSNING
jgi:hypothetical protein